eukprot:CAMPEP_0115888620 /NCGR_PEP_ID=MMETSP0287-20121206/32401_1 /TAXON_ID=412157 /ORGANISM="Chrysochromulina rotalis, Strain UIO044" /LENGTH=238 /DNA_ID=CAMNT_0003345309 /DNA_START=182 /DNA_END=898 /DNA_ORIENTATION=+
MPVRRTAEGGSTPSPQSLAGTSSATLSEAIEATSAAPVLFPRALVYHDRFDKPKGSAETCCGSVRREGSFLADGGLVANDPAALAIREARELWPRRPIGVVVSLGCGGPSALATDKVGGSPFSRAVSSLGSERLPARFYRLNPPVGHISLMEVNEARLQAMETRTREWFQSSELAHEACMDLARGRYRPLWLFVWWWLRRVVLLVMRCITWSRDAAIARAVAQSIRRVGTITDIDRGV